MGGFYQLLCLQKAMYNRYACFGLETWITGTGTTKYVSAAENAAHGFLQKKATRVYKVLLDAIVWMRTENVRNTYGNIDEVLK